MKRYKSLTVLLLTIHWCIHAYQSFFFSKAKLFLLWNVNLFNDHKLIVDLEPNSLFSILLNQILFYNLCILFFFHIEHMTWFCFDWKYEEITNNFQWCGYSILEKRKYMSFTLPHICYCCKSNQHFLSISLCVCLFFFKWKWKERLLHTIMLCKPKTSEFFFLEFLKKTHGTHVENSFQISWQCH